jgi:hypothetical protein
MHFASHADLPFDSVIDDGCSSRMLIPSYRLLFVSLLVDRLVKPTTLVHTDAIASRSVYVDLSPLAL